MKFEWCEWREGGNVARWYHGNAYRDWARNRVRMWVVPLHWVVAGWMHLGCWWCRLKHRSSWVDNQAMALLDEAKRQMAGERGRLAKHYEERLRAELNEVVEVFGDPLTRTETVVIRFSDLDRRSRDRDGMAKFVMRQLEEYDRRGAR